MGVAIYKTTELTRAFTSNNPDTIIPLMMIYDTNYLVLNRNGLKNSYLVYFWPMKGYALTKYHPLMNYIMEDWKKMYGTLNKELISDYLERDLFSKEELTYDNSEYLNKVYSAGESSIYKLRISELEEEVYTNKKNISSIFHILDIDLPKIEYLTDDIKKFKVEVINSYEKDKEIKLVMELRNAHNVTVGKKEFYMDTKAKKITEKEINFSLSKYALEGYYSIIIRLLSNGHIYDEEGQTILMKQHPVLKVGEGIKKAIYKNKVIDFAYPVLENRGDYIENISYTYILENEENKITISKNLTLFPHMVLKIYFNNTFRNEGVYLVREVLVSKYGELYYGLNNTIEIK